MKLLSWLLNSKLIKYVCMCEHGGVANKQARYNWQLSSRMTIWGKVLVLLLCWLSSSYFHAYNRYVYLYQYNRICKWLVILQSMYVGVCVFSRIYTGKINASNRWNSCIPWPCVSASSLLLLLVYTSDRQTGSCPRPIKAYNLTYIPMYVWERDIFLCINTFIHTAMYIYIFIHTFILIHIHIHISADVLFRVSILLSAT